MSNWDEIGFAQQGWQCPVCGAVYSPLTMQCFNCTGLKITNKTDTKTEPFDSNGNKRIEEIHELVRCKDCKYWLPMNRFHQDYYPGRGECELNCWVRDSDWYCADGERKNNDA